MAFKRNPGHSWNPLFPNTNVSPGPLNATHQHHISSILNNEIFLETKVWWTLNWITENLLNKLSVQYLHYFFTTYIKQPLGKGVGSVTEIVSLITVTALHVTWLDSTDVPTSVTTFGGHCTIEFLIWTLHSVLKYLQYNSLTGNLQKFSIKNSFMPLRFSKFNVLFAF